MSSLWWTLEDWRNANVSGSSSLGPVGPHLQQNDESIISMQILPEEGKQEMYLMAGYGRVISFLWNTEEEKQDTSQFKTTSEPAVISVAASVCESTVKCFAGFCCNAI